MSDQYRKPGLGMWDYLKDNIFTGFTINKKESIYCGDAAGRPKTATRHKDFSDTDLKFALNVGLTFKTPEELFLDQKSELSTTVKIDSFFKKAKEEEKKLEEGKKVASKSSTAKAKVTPYASDKQELVLFFGSPGSGKSTLWKANLSNYVRCN